MFKEQVIWSKKDSQIAIVHYSCCVKSKNFKRKRRKIGL